MPKSVRPILMLTFVNALGATLLMPVLPFVVRDLGYSDFTYSLLIAVYPAAQFFAAPILGGYADYRGRRPVLIVSQAGTLLSWVLFASAYFVDGAGLAITIIAVSRLIDGLTGGNQSVAAAYLADVVEGDQRTKVFSLQGAISGVALLVGPTFGSYSAASSIGFLGTALVAITISAVTLIAMWSLQESLTPENAAPSFDPNPFHQMNLMSRAKSLTGGGLLIRLYSLNGVFNLVLNAFTTVAILWYVDGLGVDEASTGLMLLATGLFLIFNEVVTLRIFERKFPDSLTLVIALFILPVSLLLISIPTSVVSFLVVAFLLNLSLALVIPTIQSILTRAADEHEEGAAQGINTSVTALASAIAPVAAGALYAAFGGRTTFVVLGAVAVIATLIGLASRAQIAAALGEAEASSRDDDATHRKHGPIRSLTSSHGHGRSGLFGVHLHGDSLDHFKATRSTK